MLVIPIASDVSINYGTLLLRRRLDAMLPGNPELAEHALALRKRQKGIERSNAGGWHSQGNIFTDAHPGIAALTQHLHEAVSYLCMVARQIRRADVEVKEKLYGWFNINETYNYNLPHYHPGTTWSGVYYVRTGEEPAEHPLAGCIEFLDPRTRCEIGPNKAISHSGIMRIKPEDGLLLVFPSYLEHHVHPHFGKQERITLAFNSLVEEIH